jgi:hypothetical protein
MVAQVGYSVARQSRCQVAPCAVDTWHVETRSAGFLVEPLNKVVEGFSVWASRPAALVW